MAKKTSKQGKKANSKDMATEVEETSGSAMAKSKPADKKPVDKKPGQKTEKSSKDQHKSAKASKQAPKKDGIFKKIATYFKNVRLEIKRTTWPSRQEVLRMSLIVVGALIFFGIFIAVIDWLMTWFLEFYAHLGPQDPSAVDPTQLPVDGGSTPPVEGSE